MYRYCLWVSAADGLYCTVHFTDEHRDKSSGYFLKLKIVNISASALLGFRRFKLRLGCGRGYREINLLPCGLPYIPALKRRGFAAKLDKFTTHGKRKNFNLIRVVATYLK